MAKKQNAAMELMMIRNKMMDLIAEAEEVVRDSGNKETTARAENSWLPTLRKVLEGDSIGRESMSDAINALRMAAQG